MTIRMSGLAAAVLALLAAGCNDDDEVQIGGGDFAVNTRPAFVSGTVTSTTYDGNADDLLTGGLGKTGLASATPPATSATPTAAELRRLAIYNNYRALVDMTTAGGYGVFYGPNVDVNNVAGTGEGKIAGTEVMAFSDTGNVTLLVQIPAGFESSSTNMASDQGVGNARRSIAITCGRSA